MIKKTFSNKQGEELLEFWLSHEVVKSHPGDASNEELRWSEGRKSLIVEIVNILNAEKSK